MGMPQEPERIEMADLLKVYEEQIMGMYQNLARMQVQLNNRDREIANLKARIGE